MKIRNLACLATTCLLLALALAGCEKAQQKSERYIERGNAEFAKDAFEKARVDYKNAQRLRPTDPEPFYRTGLVDEAEGDLRSAFVNFTAAEQQDKHFHPATLKIAQYFLGGDAFDETQKRITSVLAEAPDNAEAHALLASLYLHQKRYDDAVKEARTALSYDPKNVSAFAVLTGTYYANNQNDQAVESIDQGVAQNPENVPLLLLRVMLYSNMNNLPKVAESYQALFALKPDDSHFRVDLAKRYVAADKLDEADATFRAGIAVLPKDASLKREYVLFLGNHRGLEAAEQEMQTLIAANPSDDDPNFWLADLYDQHDLTDKAVALLNQIIDHEQFTQPAISARTQLARILYKRGNTQQAKALIDSVLAKVPDQPNALYLHAKMAFEDGAYQTAISDLRSTVHYAPQAQDALLLLSETLLLQGHLDLAIDTLQQLVDMNPSNYAARVRLAQMVQANGNTPAAMELIAAVTKESPDYPVAWETAARIAIDAKEWLPAEEAIKTLDRLPGQHLTAVFLRGQILLRNNRPEDAIAKFKDVIAPDPTAPLAEHALSELVDAYHAEGRTGAACAYLETLKLQTPFGLNLMGTCYKSTGKTADSIQMFDKAIAAKPTFQEPYLQRAQLYMDERNPDQAIATLKAGSAVAPSDTRAPMMEAEFLGTSGNYKDAIALYDRLLEHDPSYDAAANNWAEMVADYQFNDSAALEKARQVAERFSDSPNPIFIDTLAWVYYRQGKFPLAETMIERALGKSTNALPLQMHFHYGAILVKNQKIEKGKQELRLATPPNADYMGINEARKMLSTLETH